MSKDCPQCHKPPAEDDLLLCHMCKVPFVDRADTALHLTKSDLDQIAKTMVNSWRFWICFSAAFILALLIVGVPTVTMIGVSLANKSLRASLDQFNLQAS